MESPPFRKAMRKALGYSPRLFLYPAPWGDCSPKVQGIKKARRAFRAPRLCPSLCRPPPLDQPSAARLIPANLFFDHKEKVRPKASDRIKATTSTKYLHPISHPKIATACKPPVAGLPNPDNMDYFLNT